MALNKTYHNTSKWRPIMGILAILCIVLSSCAVKASIKSQLGFQRTAEQKNATNSKEKSFLSSSATDCFYASAADAIDIQKAEFKFAGISAAIFTCYALTLIFGFDFLKKQDKHPLYNNSDQITGSLPIFLQYRKLII